MVKTEIKNALNGKGFKLALIIGIVITVEIGRASCRERV